MKALSIRQPWAWHILNSGKDIENRCWPTKIRGRILIHVSQGMTRDEYENGRMLWPRRQVFQLPAIADLARGGIVGSVEIVDCVAASDSPWYMGEWGFVLKDPKPLPFIPYKGRLGFFEVPDSALIGVLI